MKYQGFVTASIRGGLGNQLFILATLLAYAHQTGRKPVINPKMSYGKRPAYWSTIMSNLLDTDKVKGHSVEKHAVEQHAVEQHAVEQHAVEQHAVEQHAVDNTQWNNTNTQWNCIIQDT